MPFDGRLLPLHVYCHTLNFKATLKVKLTRGINFLFADKLYKLVSISGVKAGHYSLVF